jgi:hypothetical protein
LILVLLEIENHNSYEDIIDNVGDFCRPHGRNDFGLYGRSSFSDRHVVVRFKACFTTQNEQALFQFDDVC